MTVLSKLAYGQKSDKITVGIYDEPVDEGLGDGVCWISNAYLT